MNSNEILNKYIDLIDKGYCCDCNELNCIDNFPHSKITHAIKELQQELNLLDASYITTFDSFALAVVKKYHYLINVSSNIGIIDASVIAIKKKEIMDELFLELYQKKDEKFLKMIKIFCIKDDADIRNYIITISDN